MTKKDYELIATTFKDRLDILQMYVKQPYFDVHERPELEIKGIKEVINLMARRLSEKDPKFDRTKFLQACGIEWEYAASKREILEQE